MATLGFAPRRFGVTTMAAPMPPRLLVVEDDTSLRQAIEAVLIATGYEVLAVTDGSQIDEVVEAFRPDMAILDVRLGSEPDGFVRRLGKGM